MIKQIVFDIETGCNTPVEQIEFPEFKAPANYKTAEAIDKYILKEREKYIEKAALNPLISEVMAIGYQITYTDNSRSSIQITHGKPEKDMIAEIFELFNYVNDDLGGYFPKIIGWNIQGFDLPFLLKRGWKYGVHCSGLFGEDKKYAPHVIDLMRTWGCGTYELTSLTTASKFLGIGTKEEKGAMFKQLYEIQQQEALDYLKNDVELTAKIADRIIHVAI